MDAALFIFFLVIVVKVRQMYFHRYAATGRANQMLARLLPPTEKYKWRHMGITQL